MGHTFVFIAGLHRSGTTLLFKILREHPDFSGFEFEQGAEREHEGQHLQSVYPTGKDHGGPGYFALDPAAHLTEDSPLVTSENRQRLFNEWKLHWDLSRQFLLEKSPPNLIRTRFLQALFPNSRFVVLTREPVVVSLATRKWMGWPRHHVSHETDKAGIEKLVVRAAKQDDWHDFHHDERIGTESMIQTLFEHWKAAHERFLRDAPKLDRVLTIRYEDLVAGPQEVIDRVLAFLETPSTFTLQRDVPEDRNAPYMEEWQSLLNGPVSMAFAARLVETFGPIATRFGYDLDDLLLNGPLISNLDDREQT